MSECKEHHGHGGHRGGRDCVCGHGEHHRHPGHGGECRCGEGGPGPGPGFRRRFQTREERIARLEEYLHELQAEATAVEEQIAELKA